MRKTFEGGVENGGGSRDGQRGQTSECSHDESEGMKNLPALSRTWRLVASHGRSATRRMPRDDAASCIEAVQPDPKSPGFTAGCWM